MNDKRVGQRTIALAHPPSVISFSNIGGKFEGQGPLRTYFDETSQDSFFGEKTWEKAESTMQKKVVQRALDQAKLKPGDLDYICAGDLLNQCIGSSFGLRDLGIPFFGLYGACSTMGEALALSSLLIDGGFAETVAAQASSHFCTAERQYRMPVPYGSQRPPTAQWTATAAGCTLLSAQGPGPYITHVTCGKIVDQGITDPNNMGAAMAPAAIQTLLHFFADTGARAAQFDGLYTGDLGRVGSRLLAKLAEKEGLELPLHRDCGCLLYGEGPESIGAGGSGAGCSASVLAAHILPRLLSGQEKRVLFMATGSLMSQTTFLQKESIPCIAHLVELESPLNGVREEEE